MRDASTYRGARRNEQRGSVWKNSFSLSRQSKIYLGGPYAGRIKLNRSQRWPHARTNEQAREASPSTEFVR